MKKAIMSLILAALVICAMALNVSAQAPNSIMYQGRLTNAAGDPITTNTSVTFYIYAAPTGGVPLYTAVHAITPDANGVFTVELLSVNTTVLNGTKRYLAMKVGADAEMTPRQLLTSAGYAYSAENVADMPGIASGHYTGALVSLTYATPVNLDSAVITTPSAGYVVVVASAYYQPNHITGTKDLGRFCISTSSATINYDNMANLSTPAVAATDSDMPMPVSLHAVYSVSAGIQKYYFVGDSWSGSPRVNKSRIVAMYFPTNYGTVDVKSEPAPTAPVDGGDSGGMSK